MPGALSETAAHGVGQGLRVDLYGSLDPMPAIDLKSSTVMWLVPRPEDEYCSSSVSRATYSFRLSPTSSHQQDVGRLRD